MANSSGRGYPLSPHVHTHRTLVETDDLTKENQVTYCGEASLQGSLRFFDEINGLVTYDRKIEKLTPERMLPIAKALQDAVK